MYIEITSARRQPTLGVVVQGERKPSDESGNFSVHFSLQGGLFAFKKSISLAGCMIKQSKASQVMVLALPQARCEPVVGCGDELVFSPINERAMLDGGFRGDPPDAAEASEAAQAEV